MLVSLALGLALGFSFPAAVEDPPPNRVVEVDVVDLIDRGATNAGLPSLQVKHFLFTYRFASPENRAKFLASQARYEVQLGGACARMGPLSGRGSSKIYALHDGRFYLFASEACRSGFLKAPEKMLDRPDERPKGDEAARAEGLKWIARAADAHGGAERIARVKALRWLVQKPDGLRSNDPDESKLVVRFPYDLAHAQRWGKSSYGELVLNQDGWFRTGEQSEPMAEVQRRASWRRAQTLPIFALRQASRPGFLAVAGGEIELRGRKLREVHTFVDGCAVTLGIDEKSGRILLSRTRGRGPTQTLGTLEIRYDDFRSASGVVLPWHEEALFDGQPFAAASARYTAIEVDPELPPSVFARPE
ncbi:MAG: hypothetical protein JNM84_17535 [Planctomycetes bacterium]|nr:hypothetical protein [Planctomycetota bacterium]